MTLFLKVLIPVAVLAGCGFAAKMIIENKPEARTRPQFPTVQAVEATRLQPTQFPVVIRSQGTVQATKSSTLVSEVAGTVTKLSPQFVVGGSFHQGELLMQVDERDYRIALTQARANLEQAKAQYAEELALGKQAKVEWESLGRGKASSITLRKPQLAAAQANVDSAQSQVERARLDLERTKLLAPFDGKVLEAEVDEGQFVNRGGLIGRIYAIENVDVRLPLSSRQLTYLDIPASDNVLINDFPAVEVVSQVGRQSYTWTGKLVRAEGMDSATQQLYAIARIDEPFADPKQPLRIGQFVELNVAGQILDNVFVVPRSAIREEKEVLIVDENNQLQRKEVVVAWSDEQSAAISEGLEAGVVLVTTPLSTVANGTPVRATIDGVAPPPLERGARSKGGKGAADGTIPQSGAGKNRPEEQGAGQRQGRSEGQGQGAGQGQGRPEGRGQGRPEGQGEGQGQGRPEAQEAAEQSENANESHE